MCESFRRAHGAASSAKLGVEGPVEEEHVENDEEKKKSAGKRLHGSAELQGSAKRPRIEGPRNHGTFVQGVKAIFEVSSSNADTQAP